MRRDFMPNTPAPDTERQQRKFAALVWLLLAVTTVAQLPWLVSLTHYGATPGPLVLVFLLANSQLALRLHYLPKPDPPPSWWERWVIWPYFTWTVWAGFFVPFGIADWLGHLSDEARLGALLITAFAALYTTGVPIRRVIVREIVVNIRNLPAKADGLRFAQLTDLHIGPMAPERRARQWIERVNALDVDHVLITGDLVASGTEFIPALSRTLSTLKPRGQVFAIMGNHDYFGDAGQMLVDMHTTLGHVLLRNTSVELCNGLHIAGVDDAWQKLTDLQKALSAIPEHGKTILLSHDPDLFPLSAANGVDLQVSGHVHGGQIAIPWLGRRGSVLRLFGVPWISGLYQIDHSQLWLGSGLGTTGIPVRVGVPAEIPIIKLVAN